MRAMMGFLRSLFRLPIHWRIWVGLMMLVNGAIPLLFLGTAEARFVLGAMMVGAVTQSVIHARKGFVRLLGVGHFLWLPMLPWLWLRLAQTPSGPFRNWILAVLVVDGMSVVIDVTDVARYFLGDRDPQVVPE